MPFIAKTLKVASAGTLLTSVFIYQRTKHSTFVPLAPNDPIFESATYKRINAIGNPVMQDLCVRRVPIGKVKPGLVEALVKAQEEQERGVVKEVEGKGDEVKVGEGKSWSFAGILGLGGKKVEDAVEVVKENLSGKEAEHEGEEYGLVERFCAGVWSGLGYQPQRRILSNKYQHDPLRTASPTQLWSRAELKESTYPVGTHITDHFEVVSKTPTAITVRCGDSPLNAGIRESDGLFEMGVRVIPAEGLGGLWGAGKGGEVEFSLKSVFFQGLTPSTEPPMPIWVEYLHKFYTKIWMETAIYNVMN